MNHLQQKVASFVDRHGLEADVAHRLLDAVSELGEVAKEVLKASNYGRQPFASTPKFADELGDAFFSLFCVANLTGADVERVIEAAIAKYERRITHSGTAASSTRTV